MKKFPRDYCQMICIKIGYYLKVVHKKDLIRMNVEFLIDEFDKIWLFHAKNLWIREENEFPSDHEKMMSQFILKTVKEEMVEER